MAAPNYKELKLAFEDATNNGKSTGSGAYRDVVETCVNGPCQYADTYVNREARHFDAMKVRQYPIVIGGMRWRGNVLYSDIRYKAGSSLEDSWEGRRTVLVAYNDAGVIRWKLFGKVPGSAAVVTVSGGRIRLCSTSHAINGADAAFIGCPTDSLIATLSARTGIAREAWLDALNCEPGSLTRADSRREECAVQRGEKLNALVKTLGRNSHLADIQKLRAVFAEESKAPYWFSCSLGCCTADAAE